MWVKIFISAILLYFIALLQNSFFVYFNIFGAVPNFIFIFFFLIVFLNQKENYYETIFYSLLAGFFLDVFSSFRMGVSIVALLIIGILIKKIILMLKKNEREYPFIYFIAIFTASFLAYCVSLEIYLCILSQCQILSIFSASFLTEFFYTLFFATLVFLICKNVLKNKKNSLQTGLLKNVFQ
jgi:rod shape-determining protein MreD